MQAPDEQKSTKLKPRNKYSNLIWGTLFGVLLLGILGFGAYQYKDIPTSDWRKSSNPLPWGAPGVIVEKAEAYWQSSAGNARMELRAAFYPVIHLQLGDCSGSGQLLVRFADASGVQKGETITIGYHQGAFLPARYSNVKTQGKTAEAYIETGFVSPDEYQIHKLTESAPLWRAVVTHRAAGSYEEQYVGYTCVLPYE